MKRFAMLCVFMVALAGISGCSNDRADDLYKQQIALLNEHAEAIESDAPEATRIAIKEKSDDIKKQIAALKLSEEEHKKILGRNKDALLKASQRFLDANMKKSGGDPKDRFDRK